MRPQRAIPFLIAVLCGILVGPSVLILPAAGLYRSTAPKTYSPHLRLHYLIDPNRIRDYTNGDSRHCGVHRIPMRPILVPITYGHVVRQIPLRSQRSQFPHAREFVAGGCAPAPKSPGRARIFRCPECEAARLAWMQEKPPARELPPISPESVSFPDRRLVVPKPTQNRPFVDLTLEPFNSDSIDTRSSKSP